MAQVVAVWHGETEVLRLLQAAIQRNCECAVPTTENPAPPTCPAHRMLCDQRMLDHFAFVNANLERYVSAEFDLVGEFFGRG